ncbi:MAG: hypothetical protein IBX39_09495 [Candidatus Methanoperedenaceae archaeon]|nr:hypothetical protein [Candidatus Methanoperedenaceae archaeon]
MMDSNAVQILRRLDNSMGLDGSAVTLEQTDQVGAGCFFIETAIPPISAFHNGAHLNNGVPHPYIEHHSKLNDMLLALDMISGIEILNSNGL